MAQIVFHAAARQSYKPLIGMYGISGSGKTYSALLLARGLVGPTGRIGVIDTEEGRGEEYADVIPGGYQCAQLRAPFSPDSFRTALDTLCENFDVGIIDSFSHEWEGIGGVLDWAGELEAEGKKGAQIWKAPKIAHNKLVNRITQAPIPLIVCMRGRYRSRVQKVNGKNEIVKDETVTPMQNEDFLFELAVHAEVHDGGRLRITKASSVTGLRQCFDDFPVSIATGERLALWAKGGAAPTAPKNDALARAKKQLWNATKSVHGDDLAKLEAWLRDCKIINGTLADLNAEQLDEARSKALVAMEEM